MFLDAMRSQGCSERKNQIFERRYADNPRERMPALAAGPITLNVDVILATGSVAPLAVSKVTTTIPVVIWATGGLVGTVSYRAWHAPVAAPPSATSTPLNWRASGGRQCAASKNSSGVAELIAYGPDYPDLLRRAAAYVDKILEGAKPGNFSAEQPTTFGLLVNL